MRAREITAGLFLAAALALPQVAAAELYRCTGPDGRTTFTDNPAACPGAREHQPSGAVQSVPTPPPPASRASSAPPPNVGPQDDADAASVWQEKKRSKERELESLESRREQLREFVGWCNRGGEVVRRRSSGLKGKVSCTAIYQEFESIGEQIESIQAYLDEGLEEECRRSGCLPGWIR